MADRLKQLQLNMYLRLHPNRKKALTKKNSGVRVAMENQEKEITIIGAKRPEISEVVENSNASEILEASENPEGTSDVPETNMVVSDPQDDFLLSQIDEFRLKAQQLQQLLRTKEEKAKELQELVNERTDKAEELQQIVNERQEKADGITAEVAKQIDQMADKVDAKLDALDRTMVDRLDAKLSAIDASMARMQKENGEDAERRAQATNKAISDITEQFEEVKQVSDKIDTVKAELSEKIHSESVQSYRNTQELLKGIDERLNKVDAIEKGVRSVRGMTTAIIVLTVVDLLGVAAAVVLSLGLF